MGENTHEIEHAIRQTRSDLGRNLDELGDRARELVSWRAQYRDHSRLFLGAAFGAGLVVGLAAIRGGQNGFTVVDDDDATELGGSAGAESYAVGWPATNGSGANAPNGANREGTITRARHELGETWNAIADGLVRTASARAVQYLSDLVPGFSEHVEGRYATQQNRAWRDRGAG